MRSLAGAALVRGLGAAAVSLVLAGCPQLLSDDFHRVAATASVDDAGSATGGSGNADASLSGGTGGANVPGPGGDAGQSGPPEPNLASSGAAGASEANTGGVGTGGALAFSAGAAGLTGAAGAAGYSPCEYGPFGIPEEITGLAVTGEQWGPALSADASTLYFSDWDGTSDAVYYATRTDRGTEFSEATSLDYLVPDGSASGPFLSFDGLTLYFSAQSSETEERDIWFAERLTTGTRFSDPEALQVVNGVSSDHRPWLSRDELTILFVSDRARGKGGYDIWQATRDSVSESFSTPTNLANINGTGRDESPVMSADGLTLYFASDRDSTADDTDIFIATRTDVDSDFGDPESLPELSSDEIDVDLALSADGRELFFASVRSTSPRIWRSIRECSDE